MSSDFLDAMTKLVDVLQRENAALRAMDLPGATAFLPDKTQVLVDLARLGGSWSAASPEQRRAAAAVRPRLDGLVVENQRLLERAIDVQGRVVALVARMAACEIERQAPSYGADGVMAARSAAIAVSAQA